MKKVIVVFLLTLSTLSSGTFEFNTARAGARGDYMSSCKGAGFSGKYCRKGWRAYNKTSIALKSMYSSPFEKMIKN